MADDSEKITLTTLTRKQRRVLGVLLEKAFTTPEQYPLTLKAVTTGCNQKSNRDPASDYDEDDVFQTLDQLREMGLVGEIEPGPGSGGRTNRYRHYMRQRTAFSEPQLALVTELMLRGRQSLGELRGRASRMVEIDSLDKLRSELQPLLAQGLIRSNGSLERRGIDVDHNLYPAGENREEMTALSEDSEPLERSAPTMATPRPLVSSGGGDPARIAKLETEVGNLKDEVAELRESFAALQDRMEDLRKQLGA